MVILMRKSYRELQKLSTFKERYEYLKLNGQVAEETFGSKRFLNQVLYSSPEWKRLRNKVIVRDNGCDLGIAGRELNSDSKSLRDKVIVHHINPITVDDIIRGNPLVFDMDNLITVSHMTHEAIHYGNSDLLVDDYVERTENDTCPWKR